jgi:1,4-dihydroxy-2-naphthoate octaprenyltransferase
LVGTAAASREDFFHPLVFAVTLGAALLIQIGTNLANDFFDFQHGADTPERLGPPRATQTGLITPQQMRAATFVTFAAAAAAGLYLAVVGGWPIVIIGVLSIVAGVTYTGGPWPLGYHGLGDLLVFVFFGLVAVTGTYYLQTHTFGVVAVLAAVPVGFLVTAILVVNNLRDIDTDLRARKLTLAVRIGKEKTRLQYAVLLGGAYAVSMLFWFADAAAAAWLPWLTLPMAIGLARTVLSGLTGHPLNQVLKRTALLHLLFGVLLALGLTL